MGTKVLYRNLLLVFIGFALVLSGCVTAPSISARLPRGDRYIALDRLCARYNLTYDWDGFSQSLTVRNGNNIAEILIDSPLIIVNGKRAKLSPNFKFDDGRILAPAVFEEKVVKKWHTSRMYAGSKPEVCAVGVGRIVIDAGHGGKDPGAVGRNGLREKAVTLDIAKRLRKVLQEQGISVVMTRNHDEYVSLSQRSAIANRAKADFFISIHANASRSRSPRGFEIYYLRETADDSQRASRAARQSQLDYDSSQLDSNSKFTKAILWDMIYGENRAESKDLSKCILNAMSRQTSFRSRGLKSAGFHVLKHTQIPAILVEVGFISNAKEERMLKNSFYRQQIAESLASGIIHHNKQYQYTRR
ncbi:N-acetylmuramoyl-L-alanine amidase [Candidatus Omnitrophota bacterium]